MSARRVGADAAGHRGHRHGRGLRSAGVGARPPTLHDPPANRFPRMPELHRFWFGTLGGDEVILAVTGERPSKFTATAGSAWCGGWWGSSWLAGHGNPTPSPPPPGGRGAIQSPPLPRGGGPGGGVFWHAPPPSAPPPSCSINAMARSSGPLSESWACSNARRA